MAKTRVLIADDQPLFASSLKVVLETTGDFDVVGIAHDGREAVELVRQTSADVLILDMRMPKLDGIQVIERLKNEEPIRIVALSTFDDDEYVVRAMANGACGYLLKDLEADSLISSLKAILGGSVLMSQAVAHKALRRSEPPQSTSQLDGRWVEELSRREREVFELLVSGMTNREIAASLCIAEQTVRNHVSTIYSKLGVHGRMRIINQLHPNHGDSTEY